MEIRDLYHSDSIKNYLPDDLYMLHLMESGQNNMLFQALINKDVKMLKMMSLTKRDLSDSLLFQDDLGTIQCIPPLVLSAMINDTKMVHFLLEKGAPVNYPDWMERTALMFASYRNNKTIVRDLLRYGALVSLQDLVMNKTAIDYAKTEEVRQLLKKALEKEQFNHLVSVRYHKIPFSYKETCKTR